MSEPVKRAKASYGWLELSPASRARKSLALLDLGLTPQALRFHLLRRLDEPSKLPQDDVAINRGPFTLLLSQPVLKNLHQLTASAQRSLGRLYDTHKSQSRLTVSYRLLVMFDAVDEMQRFRVQSFCCVQSRGPHVA